MTMEVNDAELDMITFSLLSYANVVLYFLLFVCFLKSHSKMGQSLLIIYESLDSPLR